uniref:ribosomal protein L19 n=1 Tax=Pachymeniopsis lanceolata TaxID=151733 RepID=UPI002A80160A|nr:ribosomal protein L19 [Pachymeniopsis lanceolata]WOL37232.1 ribosomal protein L19 [Pachymeniopsis lanceolata]
MNSKTETKSSIISKIEQKFRKNDIPDIHVGDSVQINILIQEGNKERMQVSEGVIISKNNSQLNTTITVRKVLQSIGVERVYLIHSPRIKKIVITRRSKVRKAKLYYLRQRSGKATRLKQKFT